MFVYFIKIENYSRDIAFPLMFFYHFFFEVFNLIFEGGVNIDVNN